MDGVRRLRSPRARFFLACSIGALVATLVFAFLVFRGFEPLKHEDLGGFYEGQARSWLEGRWDVAEDAISFERFRIDGRNYGYFGPWPAVLRVPVVAFTDEYDGRLSRVSMLLAFAVLLVFVSRIAWQARTKLRGDGPPTRSTLLAAGGFVFVAGCGSSALFLGSRAWVYNEAILWAVTWAVAAFAFLISYLTTPRRTTLTWCGIAATFALFSRATVGIGPFVVLGLLLLVSVGWRLSAWWRSRRSRDSRVEPAADAEPASERTPNEGRDSRWDRLRRALGIEQATAPAWWPLAIVLAIPFVLYLCVNYAKFGSLLSVPYEQQDILYARAVERRTALAGNGGGLFGLSFIPANLFAYFRPDGIAFDRLFPWVTFPDPPAHLGANPFDNIEPTASITATSTLLTLLAVLGAIAIVWRPRRDPARERIVTFRLPIIGATASAGFALVVAAITPRYEGDLLPLLLLLGAAGLFWLPTLLERRHRATRIVVRAAMVVLAAWSVWATFGTALLVQRLYSGFNPPREIAAFVDTQLDIDEALGTNASLDISFGEKRPARETVHYSDRNPALGRYFVTPDCENVFLSNGKGWVAAEAEPPASRIWRVTFGEPRVGTREPLWSTTVPGGPNSIIWARWVDDEHVAIDYEWTGLPGPGESTETLRVRPGETVDLVVRLDPKDHYFEVKHEDRVLLLGFPDFFTTDEPSVLGRQPDHERGAVEFGGHIESISNTPICDRILKRAGRSAGATTAHD